MAKSVLGAVLFLCVPSLATAQEAAAPPPVQEDFDEPQPQLPALPPPVVVPVPVISPMALPTPRDNELFDRGHRKKVAGGVLMGVGSAVLVVGEGLLIHALTNPKLVPLGIACTRVFCPNETQYDLGELISGVVLALAGSAMVYAGIPVYVVGGAQMRKAEHSLFSFAPSASSQGGNVRLRMEF